MTTRREAELAVIAEADKVTDAITDSRTDALAAALDALQTSYPDKPDPRSARIAELVAAVADLLPLAEDDLSDTCRIADEHQSDAVGVRMIAKRDRDVAKLDRARALLPKPGPEAAR